jgi:hypothetical protein
MRLEHIGTFFVRFQLVSGGFDHSLLAFSQGIWHFLGDPTPLFVVTALIPWKSWACCIVKHLSVTTAKRFRQVFQVLVMVSADHSDT